MLLVLQNVRLPRLQVFVAKSKAHSSFDTIVQNSLMHLAHHLALGAKNKASIHNAKEVLFTEKAYGWKEIVVSDTLPSFFGPT